MEGLTQEHAIVVGTGMDARPLKRFRIAPSYLGHYFELNCERFLNFKMGHLERARWCIKVHSCISSPFYLLPRGSPVIFLFIIR